MTWYWWTHWFWITVTTGIVTTTLMSFYVETYPLNPPFDPKEYNNKEELLKYPLTSNMDTDDIFKNDGDNLSAVIGDNIILNNKNSEINNNDDRISSNIVVNHIVNDSVIQSVPGVYNTSVNDSSLEENRTKGVVNVLGNNFSLLSTTSLAEGNSNSSNSNTTELSEEVISNTSNLITNHSEFIDYEPSSNESLDDIGYNQTTKSVDTVEESKTNFYKPHVLENITKEEEIIRAQIERQLGGERGRKSKVLAEYRHELKYINFSSDAKNLLARSAAVSLDFDEQEDSNVSSEALSIQRPYLLDAGAISGICFAVIGLCCGVALVGVILYRRRYLNKPQTLSEPDSSAYIDDSTIRDNSDEMYSLDNDSFLNSLEAMTIQNYWTDTVKHTKL